MNNYFYKIWIPLHLAFLVSVILVAFNIVEINWYLVFVSWFLVGPIGTGVGFHKLFSHRQFETYRPIEVLLAILGTLSCYGPILFWVGQHQSHHHKADKTTDIQTPNHGFMESFFMWRLRAGIEREINPKDFCTRRLIRDRLIMKIGRHTDIILFVWAAFLLLLSPSLLISVFIFPAIIESLRINLVNYFGHRPGIFNYRNFDTQDVSYNNLLIGWLGFGFGWHNNHHADARELVNSHRWWELDIEGLIGRLISKN